MNVILGLVAIVAVMLVAGYRARGFFLLLPLFGLFLLFRQINVDALQDGPIGSLEGRPLGLIVWLVVGAVAFGFQSIDTRRRAFEPIDRSRYLVG